jgi:hypothetical protein
VIARRADDASAWDPDVLPPLAEPDGLVLLSNESMRARRRPLAVLGLWATQAALALLVAWPAAKAVNVAYGGHPNGDGALWEPGALALTDLARRSFPAIGETLSLTLAVLTVAAVAELVPVGALIASIAFVTRRHGAPPLLPAAERSATAFGTFFTLLVGTTAVQLFTAAAAMTTALGVAHSLVLRLGDARAQQIGIVAGLLVASVAGLATVIQDVARAAAIRFRVRTVRALRLAWGALARGPASLLWSWGWRAAAGWAPVIVGAVVAGRLGGRGGSALVVLAVVHQLVALARVALRASWLAKALRAVDHAHRVLRT